MSLSKTIPSIQSLKQIAKKISSTKNIHLSQALDLVANDYGFTHWTTLLKYFKSIRINNIESFWQSFLPGEMILLSAPEGAGKLSFALNIAAYAAQKNLHVKYFSMHMNAPFIIERLNKIVKTKLVGDWLNKGYLVVEERNFDQKTLVEEIENNTPYTLLIIDYLQAIKSHGGREPYNDLLQKIKLTAQQHASRVLILSQINEECSVDSLDYIAGGRYIGKHFSHAIHIEQKHIENQDHRSLVLVKSIHYQKQKLLLQFNKGNYRFV
ncbi:DnaB-like helicase C-terminal domain-containing protein [Legionella jamestowniensis]|uniref:Replicative DNA helicase n=1 Tax=Legionella jamestowniensis TaxID=455 RepID=A0A0W0UHG1_9GAMM|nr:DnaB-like helicase C-terminal domain-containing protein [Legionella jamestowniensis]KTD07274.1 replicative DNA helicase [Legionella jamestowniensis]SFL95327.1 DnaB-like helicase C terminal domain-containing protein [Legionella jamestowniensis DSM 19215]